jgi:DNA-directed RNA polymerase specialized sigma24 family protein
MEIDEIARIVKARPGTVRVTLHRALNKLRKQLVDTKVWEGQNE